MNTDSPSSLDLVIVPNFHDLGDHFAVRRALPNRQRRMVGPFVFLDRMGPHVFKQGVGLDVRPHPHIGLATVTYLLEGEIFHRDSLGNALAIRPGEVNWMTAGSGIVHSERTAPEVRASEAALSGLQCWVALPKQHEETPPSFDHYTQAQLPTYQGEGVEARVIAGQLNGLRSPVKTLSELVYVDIELAPGASFTIPAEYSERAIYTLSGQIVLEEDGSFEPEQLLLLKPKIDIVVRAGETGARLMLLGGEPLDGPRYVVWNFVSSSVERIEQAKEDWKAQRFAKVPGETEFIPLPDLPGKPVPFPSSKLVD